MRKWPVAQYYNYSSSHVALMARNARSLPSSSSSLPSEVNDTSGPDADTSSNESTPKSLLEILRAPKRSEMARKRSVAHNLPHDGRRVKAPKHSHDPKSVQPEHRVKEFPNECLTVSAKKLFSSAAAERVLSILNQSFGDQQQLALEDYIETSLLLQYNDH